MDLANMALNTIGTSNLSLWSSVTGFFSDMGDFFSGKAFFEGAGYIWSEIINMGSTTLLANQTTGDYKTIWDKTTGLYTTFNIIAVTLLCLFFIYGFCRDCTDIHMDLTGDRIWKLFIRLIVVSNLLTMALDLIPKFMKWGRNLTSAILGDADFGFQFDGAKIYERISSASWGSMVAFLTSFLFFVFTAACGFLIITAILSRILKIYVLIPFAGMALSTLAAGGQVSQTGYSYIRTLLGLIGQAMVIAVAMLISSAFIGTIAIKTDNAILILLEYCLKMLAITTAVKGSEQLMQKGFNL